MGPERRETINSIFDAMDKGQNQQIEASDLRKNILYLSFIFQSRGDLALQARKND